MCAYEYFVTRYHRGFTYNKSTGLTKSNIVFRDEDSPQGQYKAKAPEVPTTENSHLC